MKGKMSKITMIETPETKMGNLQGEWVNMDTGTIAALGHVNYHIENRLYSHTEYHKINELKMQCVKVTTGINKGTWLRLSPQLHMVVKYGAGRGEMAHEAILKVYNLTTSNLTENIKWIGK